jgi:S-adenosylmethionine decarboxylase
MDISCNQSDLARQAQMILQEHLMRETVVAHLDKSHVTVHTYPEFHPNNDISSFRVDIDVSTCGKISPLNALDHLISSFDSDIITMDYRVRGFTRDIDGKKYYKDHEINSIQNFIDPKTLTRYDAIDVNVYQSNIFHTKMILKEIVLSDYLFNVDPRELSPEVRLSLKDRITKEMLEIYYGMNMY